MLGVWMNRNARTHGFGMQLDRTSFVRGVRHLGGQYIPDKRVEVVGGEACGIGCARANKGSKVDEVPPHMLPNMENTMHGSFRSQTTEPNRGDHDHPWSIQRTHSKWMKGSSGGNGKNESEMGES